MKKLFMFLLSKYSKTEKDRINIIREMDENLRVDYMEQTLYGNVYNYNIEFIMANPFIVKCALNDDKESIEIIKRGLNKSFDEAISFIKKEM